MVAESILSMIDQLPEPPRDWRPSIPRDDADAVGWFMRMQKLAYHNHNKLESAYLSLGHGNVFGCSSCLVAAALAGYYIFQWLSERPDDPTRPLPFRFQADCGPWFMG